MAKNPPLTITSESIAPLVYWIRHEKVMLDSDLAGLYGVETKALNRAVKRNLDRFPEDFMFQLTAEEVEALRCQTGTLKDASASENRSQIVSASNLKSQIVTSSFAHGGSRKLPYAFTEQGVAMLSSVLRSTRSVEVNIAIMRTFVQLRRLMDGNRDLAKKSRRWRKNTTSSSPSFLTPLNNSSPPTPPARPSPNAASAFIRKLAAKRRKTHRN